MKFRLSRARGVFRRIHFDSLGALVPALDYQIRKSELVDAAVGGYTHAPEMDFHLRQESPGQYFRLTEGGLYDIYRDGVAWDVANPIFIPDDEEFITGDPVDPPDGWFGEGGDGQYTLDGIQDTVAGLFTKDSATQYTLLRDAFFTNLTIDAGITLKTGGYRYWVKSDWSHDGIVDNTGLSGNPGSHADPINGGGAQAGGAAGASGYLPSLGAGGAGKEGANSGPGNPGDPGASISSSISATTGGATGGAGGAGLSGGAGGAGGAVGSATALLANLGGQRHFLALVLARAFSPSTVESFTFQRTSGGGGGGGAGSGGLGNGGGGGPAGGNGGMIVIHAKTITGSGIIRSRGGAGQVGGNGDGTGGGGGGGGGGAGGTGGVVVLVYNSKTAGITVDVAGGAGGVGGNGAGGGANGNPGNDGPAGLSFLLTAV